MIVDLLGLPLAVKVHGAKHHDSRGARLALCSLVGEVRGLQVVFADSGYRGKLGTWTQEMFGIVIQVVKRTAQHVFEILPKRWVVERTFAWLSACRRLARDYERTIASAEAFIKLAAVRLCLKRLTRLATASGDLP